MSAVDDAPEQAGEVVVAEMNARDAATEAVARALGRAHGWTDEQLDEVVSDTDDIGYAFTGRPRWWLWLDDAADALAALAPIRAAEQQEAARGAEVSCIREAAEAARRYPGFGVHASTFAQWLGLYADAIEHGRADAATERSGT